MTPTVSMVLALVGCSLLLPSAKAVTSKYVYLEGGKLQYLQDASRNQIPDFSNVGYHQGELPLPLRSSIPVRRVINPKKGVDQASEINQAISELGSLPLDANGYRGVVELTEGTFEVAGSLDLRTSGVVLRGAGETKTTILGTGTSTRDLIWLGGRRATRTKTYARQRILKEVMVGSRELHVAAGTELKVGDTVFVVVFLNQDWITHAKMDQIPSRPDRVVKQWKPFVIEFDRVIKSATTQGPNLILVLDAPIVQAIQDKWGGGTVHKYTGTREFHIGVEDLKVSSEYTHVTDEKHAASGIHVQNCMDCFVRNTHGTHFVYACVELDKGAKQVTVTDSKCTDHISEITGARRYSFSNNGGELTLVRNCHASSARHSFVYGRAVAGPNVFLDCEAINEFSTSEPHHRWSVGGLYDRVSSDLVMQDRGNYGRGHGWAGANYVAWNTEKSIVCQVPPTATQYSVGHVGTRGSPKDPTRPNCKYESFNTHVEPSSLYYAQLLDRTGIDSSHLTKAPTPAPTVPIPGPPDPDCTKGIQKPLKDVVCCHPDCGTCGGSGCSARHPGGGAMCCGSTIKKSAKPCALWAAPCVMVEVLATCSDGLKNGDEEDVDCGGTHCTACGAIHWELGVWGDCSKLCGVGSQTRTAECVDGSGNPADKEVCSEALSLSGHAPKVERVCNTQACIEYVWQSGEWGKCQAECGSGVSSRTVTCLSSEVGGAVSVPVSVTLCSGASPATQQLCESGVECEVNKSKWNWEAWGTCTVQCNEENSGTEVAGEEKRDVLCYLPDGMVEGFGTNEDTSCDMQSMPEDSRTCLKTCETFTWEPCAWFDCTASCGGTGNLMSGVQTREVLCRNSLQEVVDSLYCQSSVKPTEFHEGCNPDSCPDYNWMTSTWAACIEGKRIRTKHCHDSSGGNADDKDCGHIEAPEMSIPCTLDKCYYPEVTVDGPATIANAGSFTSVGIGSMGVILACHSVLQSL